DDHYIHIDVGGGSTELNIYQKQMKIFSQSFKLGSVRTLEGKDTFEAWEEMREWVGKYAFKRGEKITAIGTGGNINKLFELSNPEKKSNVSFPKSCPFKIRVG
ncbi:MAG: hypothetical protein HRU41_42180, partial [Saprospiraceae bacterium]|nr:hypothetical protein [Saprospiraceae bacterium]